MVSAAARPASCATSFPCWSTSCPASFTCPRTWSPSSPNFSSSTRVEGIAIPTRNPTAVAPIASPTGFDWATLTAWRTCCRSGSVSPTVEAAELVAPPTDEAADDAASPIEDAIPPTSGIAPVTPETTLCALSTRLFFFSTIPSFALVLTSAR